MSEEENCQVSVTSELRKMYEDTASALSVTSSSTMEEPENLDSSCSYLIHLTSTGPIEFKGISSIDTNIDHGDSVYYNIPTLRRPNVFLGTMDDTQMNSVERTNAWSLIDAVPVRFSPQEIFAANSEDIAAQVSGMDTQPTQPVLQKDHTVFFKELEKVLTSSLAPIRDELTSIRVQNSRSFSILQNKSSKNYRNPFTDTSLLQRQDEGVLSDASDELYDSDDDNEDIAAAALVRAPDPVNGTGSSVPPIVDYTSKTIEVDSQHPPLDWGNLGPKHMMQIYNSPEICFAIAMRFSRKLEEIPQNSAYCEGQFLLGLLQDWHQLPVRTRERIMYRIHMLYEYLCFQYGSLIQPQRSFEM